MKKVSIGLKVATILWLVWGLVHIIAGVLTIIFVLSGEPASAIAGIADATDPIMLQLDYPKAVVAILGQHGFNLV
jgi:hypothetical protein